MLCYFERCARSERFRHRWEDVLIALEVLYAR